MYYLYRYDFEKVYSFQLSCAKYFKKIKDPFNKPGLLPNYLDAYFIILSIHITRNHFIDSDISYITYRCSREVTDT